MTRNVSRFAVGLVAACVAQFGFAEQVLEELVVTATKRAEGIQEVPIAVSAFTGEDLEQRGIQDIHALQQVAPSLAVYNSNGTAGNSTIRIRGVGTTGNNPGLESAVGTFIDGVYRSRSGQAVNDLVDIQQIEILRGPQGTLFGKNTSAGALVVTSNKPQDEFGAELSAGIGNYDDRNIRGFITGPIVEGVLSGRLAGAFRERDGYYENVENGKAYDDRDRYTLKGQLLWTPTETFDARLFLDYTERDESCCPAKYERTGPNGQIISSLGGFVNPDFETDGKDVGVDFDPFEDIEDKGVALEANYDAGFATITGLISYREYEAFSGQDIDFSSADILRPQDADSEFENFAFELRATGTWESIDWLAGFYTYTEDSTESGGVRFSTQGGVYTSQFLLGPGNLALAGIFTDGAGYDEAYDQEVEGWSFFTRNT